DKDLFNKMLLQERIACVVEEARVIACERILIPKIMRREKTIKDFPFKEIHDFYNGALRGIFITLTGGWFGDLEIKYYFEALNDYGMDFPFKIKVEELDKDYTYKLRQNEKNIDNRE